MSPVSYGGGVTVVQGGSGPNPSDTFVLGIRFADSNATPTDATGVAFTFPDANATPSDLTRLGLTYGDVNAAATDLLLSLGVGTVDTNLAPTDVASYTFGLTLADSNAAPADATKIAFTLADANAALADARSSVASLWGTGSAGPGSTNPANADGPNNGTTSDVSTVVAGATTASLTSNCGNAAAAGTFYTSIVFKGWYRLQTVLSTSTAKVVVHSSTAAFTDIVIETLAAAAGDSNHLTTPFTSAELIGTINTLAKLQSAQIVYSTTDAVAGVSKANVTVDASSLLLDGVI